jgi:hypothetical protein
MCDYTTGEWGAFRTCQLNYCAEKNRVHLVRKRYISALENKENPMDPADLATMKAALLRDLRQWSQFCANTKQEFGVFLGSNEQLRFMALGQIMALDMDDTAMRQALLSLPGQ